MKEVQFAVKLKLEDAALQAHCAAKPDVKSQNMDVAVGQRQFEQMAALHAQMILAAGIDLKQSARSDADLARAERDPGGQGQRKNRGIAFEHQGDAALDVNAAQWAQIQRQRRLGSDTCLVYGQVHGPFQFQRAIQHIDAGVAGYVQRLWRQGHLDKGCALAGGVDGAHGLGRASGVDLQQEVTGKRKGAAVYQHRAGATHFQTAVDTGADQAQCTHHCQRVDQRQIQACGNAYLHARFGHNNAKITVQRQRAIEQFKTAVTQQLYIHARPFGLAGRGGADGVLPVGKMWRCRGGVGVVVQRLFERIRHVVNNLLPKCIEGQVQVDVQACQTSQFDPARQFHAQGHARNTFTLTNHQQAGCMPAEGKTARANAGGNVCEHRDAIAFAGAEVQNAIHLDQAEQVQFGLAKNSNHLLFVIKHDGFRRISGRNGVAEVDQVVGGVGVLVDRQGHVLPGALGKINGGEFKAGAGIVIGNRTGCCICGVA